MFEQAKQFRAIDADSGKEWRCSGLPLHEPGKCLVFLLCGTEAEAATAYLQLLALKHTVSLLDGALEEELLQRLVALYCPDYILARRQLSGYQEAGRYGRFLLLKASVKRPYPLHPDLALLLTTSGTTGSPKWVRLSYNNIESNARSISTYLEITAEEKAITSLPFHYSFGLSVVHSHAYTGATLVCTESSILQQPFWDAVKANTCTSLAGVPYTYQLLDRLGLETLPASSLKTLTQAGGHLSEDLVKKFSRLMQKRRGRFFVMYGQTEATARIAYLPPHYAGEKSGAIGIAIPEGCLHIEIAGKKITDADVIGELVYTGPNVMMGYAETPEDLALGDVMHGVLHTGDLGYFDRDHIFYVTGRTKRFAKVYGLRISLDDIERELNRLIPAAAGPLDKENAIAIWIEGDEGVKAACLKKLERFGLNPVSYRFYLVDKLPRTPSGKIDAAKLQAE